MNYKTIESLISDTDRCLSSANDISVDFVCRELRICPVLNLRGRLLIQRYLHLQHLHENVTSEVKKQFTDEFYKVIASMPSHWFEVHDYRNDMDLIDRENFDGYDETIIQIERQKQEDIRRQEIERIALERRKQEELTRKRMEIIRMRCSAVQIRTAPTMIAWEESIPTVIAYAIHSVRGEYEQKLYEWEQRVFGCGFDEDDFFQHVIFIEYHMLLMKEAGKNKCKVLKRFRYGTRICQLRDIKSLSEWPSVSYQEVDEKFPQHKDAITDIIQKRTKFRTPYLTCYILNDDQRKPYIPLIRSVYEMINAKMCLCNHCTLRC